MHGLDLERAERRTQPSSNGLVRVLGLGEPVDVDRRAGGPREPAVAGDMVGVVVGFEHVLDSNPVQAGKVEVWLDLPLRVDDRGDPLVDVADQVGRATEILVDHLPEKHRFIFPASSARPPNPPFLTKIVDNEFPTRTLVPRLRDAAQRQHARLPGAEETGIAGRPEEYFEALRHSGRPRRPEEYFDGVDDRSILDHLGERGIGDEPQQRSPLWSRAAYDRYLEWAIGGRDDAERGLRGEADVGLLRRLRQPAAQHSRIQRAPARRAAAARSSPTSPSSASCGRTRSARPSRCGRRCRRRPGARRTPRGRRRGRRRVAAVQELPRRPPPAAPLPLRRDRAPAAARSWSRRPIGTRSSSTRGSSRCWSSTRTSPPITRTRPGACSSDSDLELAARPRAEAADEASSRTASTTIGQALRRPEAGDAVRPRAGSRGGRVSARRPEAHRPTSSTSTPTTRGATCSPTASRCRRRTSSCSPTRECSFARRSARCRPAPAAAPACSPARAAPATGCSASPTVAGGSTTTATTSSTPCAGAGYHSALIGEQHISEDPRGDRLRRGDPELDSTQRERDRALGDRHSATASASRSSSRSASSRRTAASPPRPRSATRSTRCRRRTCPTRRARARTWRRSRPAPARSTRGSGPCSTPCTPYGLVETTLIICTTDHGLAFPGAKATLYDRGTGVMLIMRGPGFTGGKVVDALVSHLDVYPTVCELAGIEPPRLARRDLADAARRAASGHRSTTRSSPR